MLESELVPALEPGTVISGKYRVERVLGRGGMGVVVAVTHLELNQALAIKVLLPNMANRPEAVTRFVREGRSAAQLTSPHTAKVHDTGHLSSGEPFLVMELLRGCDLQAHLATVGRVPLAQAVDWVLQAAHALSEAHELHIIHRDVKPANLFLAETSTGPQIKVLDFGISKHLDSTEALTHTASGVGTPRYMAPEQMRSPKLADARGDVWSLGIVLYELTTGQQPFHGDSVTSLCFDVMERTPVPPSALVPELPSAFDEVVERCLAKDPEDRFQSVRALATALHAVAPGSRSSGFFTSVSREAAAPIAGTTPAAATSTPRPAHPTARVSHAEPDAPRSRTVTLPLAQPLVPESSPRETMRAWNTMSVPRPAVKTPSRMHIIGLAIGLGVGIAIATVAGMLVAKPRMTAPAKPPEPVASAATTSTGLPAATRPTEPLVTVADAPPPPGTVLAPVFSSPSMQGASATPKAPPPSCNPPYTVDQRRIRIPKPQCVK